MRLIRSVILLFIILGLCAVVLSRYPILVKFFAGSARVLEKTQNYAVEYPKLKVLFYEVNRCFDGSDCKYLLIVLNQKENIRGGVLWIDLQGLKSAGLPTSFGKKNYEVISGTFFQSEVGENFAVFEDYNKGYNFDTKISFSNNLISFQLPEELRNLYNSDSMVIRKL